MISRLFFEKSGPFLVLLKEIVSSMNYTKYLSPVLLCYVLFLSDLWWVVLFARYYSCVTFSLL